MLQEEIVLIETAKEDGSKARIVFRNGGDVDAAVLERLCNKVRCSNRDEPLLPSTTNLVVL